MVRRLAGRDRGRGHACRHLCEHALYRVDLQEMVSVRSWAEPWFLPLRDPLRFLRFGGPRLFLVSLFLLDWLNRSTSGGWVKATFSSPKTTDGTGTVNLCGKKWQTTREGEKH